MTSKRSLLTALLTVLFVVRFLVVPEQIADYATYHAYISDVMGVTIDGSYEWLTYKTFGFFGALFGEATRALYYLYLYNAFIFSLLFMMAVANYRISAGGVLLAFSLFAPLLFFVTLRATPAYMLVLLSIVYLTESKKLSLLLILGALFFHISAIFPLVIVMWIIIASPLSDRKLSLISKAVYIIAFSHVIAFVMEVNLIPAWLANVFEVSESIEKYKAYADVSQLYSISHYLYLALVLILFHLSIKWRSHFSAVLISYFHLSMLTYVLLMISPVTAYRMSVFFMLPLMLMMPWRNIFKKLRFFAYVASSCIFASISFNGILL